MMNALHPMIDAPLWAVLLFKITAILAAAWAGHAALMWANPRWRVLLWRVTAVGLVVLPGVTWLLPGLDIRLARPVVEEVVAVETGADEIPRTVDRAPALPLHGTPDEVFFDGAREITMVDLPPVATGIAWEPPALTAAEPPVRETSDPADAESGFTPWVTLPAVAWIAGVVLLGFRLCLGHLRIRTLARRSQPAPRWVRDEAARVAVAIGCNRPVDVVQSADIPSPVLCGLRRSLLVLPSRMCEPGYRADLPAILAHELAHARVYDVPWNAVLQVISSVFWFHPLVWRVRGAHLAACELAADSASASFVGNVADYCRTLARVAVDAHTPVPACGIAMARTSSIGRRLTALKKRVFHLPLRRRSVAAFGFVALLGVALLGSLQFAVAEPAATTEGQKAGPTETPQGEPDNRQEEAAPLAQDTANAGSLTPPPKLDWLEGSGKNLRMCIRGEVVNEDGAPAKDFRLRLRSSALSGERDLPVDVEGNRFSCWIPVGEAPPFYLFVSATSPDGRRISRIGIEQGEIRQAAIEGLVLKMKRAERMVEVKVVKDGKPVTGATVVAEVQGPRITAKTNDHGIAKFGLMNREKVSQLTAWTEDFMIGGYSFTRDPPRDPLAKRYTVELQTCRSQKVRVVNVDDDSPVAGLPVELIAGTGPPDFQYIGKGPDSDMKTDAKGEAVDRWFPDWEKHGTYIEVRDPHWVKAEKEETVDGVIVVKVKKSQFSKRKRVVGRVESADGNAAGFSVRMRSFEGEVEGRGDCLDAVTDRKGEFVGHYLPGATYCMYVNGARVVGNTIDVIPYDPLTEKITVPTLKVFEGRPVDVVVTAGPEKRPIPYQSVYLKIPHDFSWHENGRTRHGQGGRGWYVPTNEQGRGRAFAPAGAKVEATIFSPTWRATESTRVKTEGVTTLRFHKKIAEKRKITGRVTLPENLQTDLNEAVVEIGSVDGETNERVTLKTNADGAFQFDSAAVQIGIYARTKDGKAAAAAVIDRPGEPIEVQLKPTADYQGRLLGKDDRPIAGHAVRAPVYVRGAKDYTKLFPTGFSAATIETKTDANGNFTLRNLPCELDMTLCCDPVEDSTRHWYLDEFYLTPGESRPRAVSRLWKPKTKIPFAKRYTKALRDCRLSHLHMMVVLLRPSDDAKQFIDAYLKDYERTKEVMSFLELRGTFGDGPSGREVAEFAKSKNWPTPEDGKVLAVALDATGKELGRAEFDYKDVESAELADEFVRKYAPERVDAKKKWDAAFAEAKKSDRKVWARISQRYCGPCFRLARWLDDQKAVLEKDYVLLKIDDVRDLHGYEVAERLTRGKHHGVPFFAIFDPDGTMLIDSACPMGNIGHPNGFEGKKHLRKMLMTTRKKITPEEVEAVVGTLED